MRKLQLVILALVVSQSIAFARGARDQPRAGAPVRRVDLVVALDTSNSMDGLIDAARQKLWDVVNLLGQARPQPILRVGLISYGNDGYDRAVGWVRKDSDLTADLDSIYARLFALHTNGGTEYVARAVHSATTEMAWDQDPKTLKILFVAGNEPATQDPQIPVEAAVRQARAKGIFVNTIYCGAASRGIAEGWERAATAGAGKFAAIDQSRVVAIATPMDTELSRLSGELNRTYVAYGSGGGRGAQNQAAQDENARQLGGAVAASRAHAKASALYRADDWDLVDAKRAGKKDVARMPAAELPPPMQRLSAPEREAYLDHMANERTALQTKIADLAARRDAYVASEKKKRVRDNDKTLDDALGDGIRSEAVEKGFSF